MLTEVQSLTATALLGREIRVTKQMVRDGYHDDCRHCPVALALLAVIPNAKVHADYESIHVNGVRFSTPDNVTDFMRRFDTRRRRWVSGIRFALTKLYGRASC